MCTNTATQSTHMTQTKNYTAQGKRECARVQGHTRDTQGSRENLRTAQHMRMRTIVEAHRRHTMHTRNLHTAQHMRMHTLANASKRHTAKPQNGEAFPRRRAWVRLRNKQSGNTAHQPRRADGTIRPACAPPKKLHRAGDLSTLAAKPSTAPQPHEWLVSALRRVVAVIINR